MKTLLALLAAASLAGAALVAGLTATGGKPIPPTGRKVSIATNYVFRVEDGRMAEIWETWDEAALYLHLLQPEPKPTP